MRYKSFYIRIKPVDNLIRVANNFFCNTAQFKM